MNRSFAKNEVIFRQGDAADCMYEVLSGSVGIYANYGESNEKLLTTLTAGGTFGEMGIIDNLPRSASAVALDEATSLEQVSSDSFAEYFQRNPEQVLTIMKHMSGRIRGLTGAYLDACRAVTESEEAAKTGKKSSWLKEHVKRFLQDYADATAYMSQHPEMFTDHYGHNGHFFL